MNEYMEDLIVNCLPYLIGLAIMAPIVAFGLYESLQPKPEVAAFALKSLGYTQIKITGVNWWACGGGSLWRTGFSAVGRNGAMVNGTVCSTLFKDPTVRIRYLDRTVGVSQ